MWTEGFLGKWKISAAGTLVQLFAQNQKESNERTDPILAGYVQSLLDAFGPDLLEQSTTPEPENTLLDPLTRKEIRQQRYSDSSHERNGKVRYSPVGHVITQYGYPVSRMNSEMFKHPH